MFARYSRHIRILLIAIVAVSGFAIYRAYNSPPDVNLDGLQLKNLDGTAFDFKKLYGKKLFINYWATW